MAGNGQAVATITSQVETVDVDSGNRAVTGYRIQFQTRLGNTGTVFVPRAQYNEENVRAAVRAQAVKIDSLHNAEIV